MLEKLSFSEIEKMLEYAKKTALEYGIENKKQKALGNSKAASDYEQHFKTWERYLNTLDEELKRKIILSLEE